MLVTELTPHRDMSTLNCAFPENKSDMSVTRTRPKAACPRSRLGRSPRPTQSSTSLPRTQLDAVVHRTHERNFVGERWALANRRVNEYPVLHVLVPSRTNSPAHVGVQDEPSVSDAVQSPKPPFSTAAEASRRAVHSAGVSTYPCTT